MSRQHAQHIAAQHVPVCAASVDSPSLTAGHPGAPVRLLRLCAKEAALRAYDGPSLFAVPGNHDWIDGLDCFQRHIQHKGWMGGWLMPQVGKAMGLCGAAAGARAVLHTGWAACRHQS